MKSLIPVFLLYASVCFSQTMDYNTKKGFAVDGYDVVAYFNNQALEGSKEFVSKFDGVNYKFASKENLNSFNKNPEKYIPQYGGYCAYAVGAKGSKVNIDPETFEVKNGKLYLFYNSWGTNTLKLWKEENPEQLRKQADAKWEQIKFKK
ncbi:YHS domain-containing (seleno)protein [Mariniflexile sp. AS56]|uniref:YHS domain-containing (seleno)protein n=1 Tax=Mariniflexile sp. AS56 TaxID=3063957 RepID=UPI0026EB74C1|nr:YHS domain-containing (seleno)protein [Mariniflexile sp. AS56]MDO7170927.1 YHS domain-containing (seleno)protein [Mariniflexile sp. AS56]